MKYIRITKRLLSIMVFLLPVAFDARCEGVAAPNVFELSESGHIVFDDSDRNSAWSEMLLQSSAGNIFLVEGRYSQQEYKPASTIFHDTGIVTHPYVYLCRQSGRQLIPFQSLLSGGERDVVVDFAEINGGKPKEIFMTVVHADRSSEVVIYVINDDQAQVFYRAVSVDTNARVEMIGNEISIYVSSGTNHDNDLEQANVQQTFKWNEKPSHGLRQRECECILPVS